MFVRLLFNRIYHFFIVLDVLSCILLIHILRTDVYGRVRMFLTLSQTSLG